MTTALHIQNNDQYQRRILLCSYVEIYAKVKELPRDFSLDVKLYI